MVAASLSLMVLTILLLTLLPISRSSARTVTQLELSHLAQLASQRLLQDLHSAPLSTIAWPEPERFQLRPLERTSATGKPILADYQVAYSSHDQSLLRWEIPSNPALRPGPTKTLLRGCLQSFDLHKLGQQTLELRFQLRSGNISQDFREVVFLRNEARL